MKKKTKLLLTTSLALGSVSLVSPLVVSCSEDTVVKSNYLINNVLPQFQITLNADGKKLTAVDFLQKAKSGSSLINVFSTYTNLNSLEQELRQHSIYIDSLNDLNYADNSINSLSIKVTFNVNGSEKIQLSYVIVGFKTQSDKLRNIITKFNQEVVPNLKAKLSKPTTSEEVWNYWYDSQDFQRNRTLFSFIEGLPESIITDSKYEGIWIELKSSFSSQSEAKQIVKWNNQETDSKNKGTTITLNFKFKASIVSGDSSIIVYEYLPIEISGFTSFQEKIDKFATDFVAKYKANIQIKNAFITPAVFSDEFKNNSLETSYSILSKYLSGLPVEDVADSNGVLVSSIKMAPSTRNDKAISLHYLLSWNGVQKEISFEISGFLNDDQYLIWLKQLLQTKEFTPSLEALEKKYSSKNVLEQYNKDNSSLLNNIQGLPVSSPLIKYVFTNVRWNQTASNDQKGSTLYLNIQIDYLGRSVKVENKEVIGFTTPYSQYQIEFNEFVKNITLLPTSQAPSNVVDVVNIKNYKTYITGVPVDSLDYSVKNLTFDYSKGVDGELIVNFNYIWHTDIDIDIDKLITKTVPKFRKYTDVSTENFTASLIDMIYDDYFDRVKKKDINYADWLTSYFGSDLNKETYKTGFSRLWNLPFDKFGIDFQITNVRYKKTKASLSDTQLEVSLSIKDLYNAKNTFSKTYVISGFMDPFNDSIREMAKWGNNYEMNKSNITHYWSVDSLLRCGDANTQIHAALGGYWRIGYYSKYFDGGTQNLTNLQKEFVEFAKTIVNNYAVGRLKYNGITTEVVNVSWLWKGEHRYGNENSVGTVTAPVYTKFRWKTNVKDKFGNTSTGKYNDYETSNLILWLYFRNRWWGG